MEYFNRYTDFLLEYQEPETATETDKETEKLVYEEFTAEFNDSFGYNRTKIDDDGYKPELEETLTEFKTFIAENKTDDGTLPTISTVDIASQGSASWVNTNYPKTNGGPYNYDNNQQLANDRGKELADRVIEDVKVYLNKVGYDVDSITFNIKSATGKIDNKRSRIVLNKFVTENFESNKTDLVNQMASAAGGKDKTAPNTKVKFFKDESDEIKTRPDYEDSEENYEVFTLEEVNADRIYELLSESPAYVTYTARLKSGDKEIRTYYKDIAQKAYVKVVINAEAKTVAPTPEPEEPEPEPKGKGGKKFDLKSIPFKKDSSELASTVEYQNLVKIISDPTNNIKYVALVGHAEGDDELGKKTFDPNSKVRLTQSGPVKSEDPKVQKQLAKKQQAEKQKRANLQQQAEKQKRKMIRMPSQEKKTYFTENVLADLRFILGKERSKKVVTMLHNDLPEWTTKAAKEFRLISMSLGTMYGEKLTNQKIVQVFVQTEDGTWSDSESGLGLFPNGYNNNKAETDEVALMKALKYNLKAFYSQYARADKQYTTKITPAYSQMANPKNTAQSRIYYNFRNKF